MFASVKRQIAASPSTAAVIVMLASMFLFTSNDAVGKWLSGNYSVGQLVLVRSLVATAVLLPFALKSGARSLFLTGNPWMLGLRVLLTLGDSFTFYYAVSLQPLADVMTFWLAAPIYVAAFSPFLLGERVGWRRWTAIGIGFLGVIVALDHSRAMFSPASLVSLAGSLCFGLSMLTARSMRDTPGLTMIFWQSFGGVIIGLMTIPFGWKTPSAFEWPAFAVLGLLAMIAHMAVNYAFKLADAATVAPLQYTQLFWAILFGWMFFGDLPSISKFIGAVLIIASGLFIFFRERRLKLDREKFATHHD